jgi:8-oxo-dGTP diphosphatase
MDFTKQHIKTSVVACIIDGGDHVVLTRRCIEPFCGQWVMPGGKIDFGESLLAALHREVREEVGLEVRIDGLIDVYEHVGIGPQNDHYVILYYRAHPLGRELRPNGAEVTEACWVPAQELHRFSMTPGTRHVLARLFPADLADPGQPADELAERVRATGSP